MSVTSADSFAVEKATRDSVPLCSQWPTTVEKFLSLGDVAKRLIEREAWATTLVTAR